MAFENITKGEFKSDFTYSKGKKCTWTRLFSDKKLLAEIKGVHCGVSNKEMLENHKFIYFCFNLQQKLDISCYEEVIEALEEANRLLCHEGFDTTKFGFEQVLTKAKKQ